MEGKQNETGKVWDYESNKNDPLAEKVKKDPTIVMTNSLMAKYLLDRIDFKDEDVVLEPCLGDGAFYNNFPENTINKWCEINEGIDFLESTEAVDYTISNPPFIPRKLFWKFHEKAMEITRKEIYWLINLSSMNVFTPKRLDEMTEKGWFIQDLHIVADKRWFGRYCFIKISKTPSTFITSHRKTF